MAAERWPVWRNAEWRDELRAARDLTYAKLPKYVKDALALPKTAREKLVRERRKLLAERANGDKPRAK
ncbi:MAG TPA: hypothetical protein VIJ79_03525 [Acidobacteriaceae bacterium]